MQTSAPQKRPGRVSSRKRQSQPPQELRCNLVAIPVRLDQSPGEIYRSDRCMVHPVDGQIAFELERSEPLPQLSLVVGVAFTRHQRRFTLTNIRSQCMLNGSLRVEVAQHLDDSDDLFSNQNLTPYIDPLRFCFEYKYDRDILRQWESIGVLRQYVVDRVLVCPDCQSIPTWRYGCPQCGSARYSCEQLIHHFACAHVERAEAFQPAGDALRCPKCRMTRLIAGTDFQYIPGPLDCFDCGASGCQSVLCCLCHQCQRRFDSDQARELELHGYHVDRLDLLDLVAASQ